MKIVGALCCLTVLILPIVDAEPSRLALVIANTDYPTRPLEGPLEDGQLMTTALQDIGFSVTYRQNLSRDRMNRLISEFAASLESGDIVFVFFAGHGQQYNGESYLIPIDANASSPVDAAAQSVPMTTIYRALRRAKTGTNIVVLDACRSNPFATTAESGLPADVWVPGLAAPLNPPAESMISYPVGPGQATKDPIGGSLYSRVIAQQIRHPGLEISEIFRRVTSAVKDLTAGRQQPWTDSSLSRPFFFRDAVTVTAVINYGDDDVQLLHNDAEVLTWQSQGNKARELTLVPGNNHFTVKVYNQKSFVGNNTIFGAPEGWKYDVTLRRGATDLWRGRDGEDVPPRDGPRHGHTFTAATVLLYLDPSTGTVSLKHANPDVWK